MRGLGERGRRIGAALLSAAVPVAIVAVLIKTDPLPVIALRDLVFDNYQRLAPRPYNPEIPVRVIVIDDESLARYGQWPWPRSTIAQLIDRLGVAGAAAIALDIVLSEPERSYAANGIILTAGDDELATVMKQRPVVIGQALTDDTKTPPITKTAQPNVAGDLNPLNKPCAVAPAASGAIVPLDILAEAAHGIGAMNFVPDRDLVVRRMPTLFCVNGNVIPNLGIEALRVVQGSTSPILVKMAGANEEIRLGSSYVDNFAIVALKVGDVLIETGKDGSVLIHFAGEQPGRHIPAWRVLDGSADLKALGGGIALVGATAAATFDMRATPLQANSAGVDAHAEFLEHVLSGTHLSRPENAAGAEILAAVFATVLVALFAVFARPIPAACGLMALLILVVAASWYAFTQMQLLVDPSLPVLGVSAAFTSAMVSALRRSDRDKRQIREAFKRYLSPELVEAVARDPSLVRLGGEIRPITVLFSDVRGFTARSEQLGAEDVLSFLNAVHAPLTEEVFKSRGTLDKFIGDGLMAFWNAPFPLPDHVRAALRCALAMQAALKPIDEALARDDAAAGRPHVTLAVGIGVHTGSACVGHMGSAQRVDYSAIGDTVNTAARIEQTSKIYGIPIIVSEEVVCEAPNFVFLQIDEAQLRGRQQSTTLYALLGEGAESVEHFREFKVLHDLALAAYLAGAPDAELRIGLCERHPLGQRFATLYQLYRDRLAAKKVAATAIVDG